VRIRRGLLETPLTNRGERGGKRSNNRGLITRKSLTYEICLVTKTLFLSKKIS